MKKDNKTKKIAIMYDFDKTLSKEYMQEYSLLPDVIGVGAEDFWNQKTEVELSKEMDPVLAYLYLVFKIAKKRNIKITKEVLQNSGRNIDFYPGVEEWFERINQYGEERGLIVEHYIISSGIKEIIEGSSIARHFKRIYACEFHYDDNDEVDWISASVNFTNKTQFVFRINKGFLEIYDQKGVNKYVPKEDREIPFSNMIYIGDGETDVPCMKIVKARGGSSIAVYESKAEEEVAKELFDQERVSFYAKADYREGKSIDAEVKKIINKLSMHKY